MRDTVECEQPSDDLWGSFGSWNPGVCHFLFCDGSLKRLSTDTSSTVLSKFTCRHDFGQDFHYNHKLEDGLDFSP
ncbi:MAG: DUF1559 domain-containing protein [Pirellulales bacterium]|nr:DUF1559 domain-containing protein [Pirellulales bacterium]